MTQRLYSIFTVLLIGAFGLFFAGCDSGGGGNEPPSASISVDSMESRTVYFSASESNDPDGSITSYSWEFGDGSTATGETASNQYADTGTYTAKLTVTDDSETSDSASTEVDLTPTTFQVKVENVGSPAPILKSGAFAGGDEVESIDNGQNPLKPGEAYEFSFTAGPNEIPGLGMQFSLATMFVQSNDIFYAFKPGGIPLFNDDGTPVSGNVTDSLAMWDAGTEEDQKPGTGSDQAPRQDSLNQGPDDNNNLTLVANSDGGGQPTDDGFSYPQVPNGIKVTIQNQTASTGGYKFTVRVENVSDETGTTVNGSPLVISPGSYAVHWNRLPDGSNLTYPQFVPGEDATGTGIENIAEDGMPKRHAGVLAQFTGVTVPLSPGGIAAHTDDLELFATGESASPGVERIAEDGNPRELVTSLQGNVEITDGGAFAKPDGADQAGPIGPGGSYTTTVDAVPGDRLSLGTMYVQSNDAFYAFDPDGLPLWDDGGNPISGDVTGKLRLYDAGTEVDEEPGVGLNQAPRQPSANTGDDEGGNIVRIQEKGDGDPFLDNDAFNYAPILDSNGNPTIIKVTVTPQ